MPKKLTQEEVITRFKTTHGDTYDYSKVCYTNSTTKVTIICKSHGEFEQTPERHHNAKQGCPKCGVSRRAKSHLYTKEDFVKKSRESHGDKYDYSKTVYTKSANKVLIVCPIHGDFIQQAHNHMLGQGCNKCANEVRKVKLQESNDSLKVSYQDVIEQANKLHKSKYTYAKEEDYKNLSTLFSITCPTHGPFEQRMSDHLKGNGCPSCASGGFDSNAPAVLYYLSINKGQAYKIGVTNRSVEDRFILKDLLTIDVLFTLDFTKGREAYLVEQSILKTFKPEKYKGSDLLSTGNTEVFKSNVLEVVINQTTDKLNKIKELTNEYQRSGTIIKGSG